MVACFIYKIPPKYCLLLMFSISATCHRLYIRNNPLSNLHIVKKKKIAHCINFFSMQQELCDCCQSKLLLRYCSLSFGITMNISSFWHLMRKKFKTNQLFACTVHFCEEQSVKPCKSTKIKTPSNLSSYFYISDTLE